MGDHFGPKITQTGLYFYCKPKWSNICGFLGIKKTISCFIKERRKMDGWKKKKSGRGKEIPGMLNVKKSAQLHTRI